MLPTGKPLFPDTGARHAQTGWVHKLHPYKRFKASPWAVVVEILFCRILCYFLLDKHAA